MFRLEYMPKGSLHKKDAWMQHVAKTIEDHLRAQLQTDPAFATVAANLNQVRVEATTQGVRILQHQPGAVETATLVQTIESSEVAQPKVDAETLLEKQPKITPEMVETAAAGAFATMDMKPS